MKNIIIVLCFLFAAFSASAQSNNNIKVPAKVKDKVLFLFPHTLDVPVTYTMEGKNYKATMIAWEVPAVAVLDSVGNVIYMEKRLHEKYMPAKVMENLKKAYPDYKILMVFEKTDDKGNKTYKTNVQITTDFLFDAKGNWIK